MSRFVLCLASSRSNEAGADVVVVDRFVYRFVDRFVDRFVGALAR
jgi:hypothetical protein